ncbi:MAG: hypothetical protein PHW62_07680 [Candidatus Ratteibacteria bacterium]|nr:hypothetical protein [Candidatus Ratteibacteria bacterium]
MDDSLRNKDIEEVLKNAQTNLGTVGNAKGIMTIFVKCTLDICEKLEKASSEIEKFNTSTTKLNSRLVWLTGVLAFATLVGMVATLKTTGLLR